MFQPRAKLEFIQRYCAPTRFSVCVDIDASEKGRTGGKRRRQDAKKRQKDMQYDACLVEQELRDMKVADKYRDWRDKEIFADLMDDGRWRGPDIMACDRKKKLCVIAEVEAESSGQPETKLYKAIGQIIRAASEPTDGWSRAFVVVVWGDDIAKHLERMTALNCLKVNAVVLGRTKAQDRVIFGSLDF